MTTSDVFNAQRLKNLRALYTQGYKKIITPDYTIGLHLDNEAIRAAVGLRLGMTTCEPHTQ